MPACGESCFRSHMQGRIRTKRVTPTCLPAESSFREAVPGEVVSEGTLLSWAEIASDLLVFPQPTSHDLSSSGCLPLLSLFSFHDGDLHVDGCNRSK